MRTSALRMKLNQKSKVFEKRTTWNSSKSKNLQDVELGGAFISQRQNGLKYDSFVKPVSIRRKTIDIMDTPNSNEPGSSNSNEPEPSLVPRSENGLENESVVTNE